MKVELRNCVELSLLVSVMSVLMAGASPVSRAGDDEESTAAAASLGRSKRSHRSRASQGGLHRDQYMMLCPQARCESLPEECKEVELIVFEYSFFNGRGRRVEVRCESCSYCLDLPEPYRAKRAIRNPVTARGCPASLRCPDVPNECSNVKMVNVLVQETQCRRCPACFDGTLLA